MIGLVVAVSLLLLLLIGSAAEEENVEVVDLGPLANNHSLILEAAQRALDVYATTANNDEGLFEATMYEGVGPVLSAVWFQEADEFCYATFRGRDEGFGWVASMSLDLSRVHVKNKRKKKCRVVKHYKDLYVQKKMNGYKETLDGLLSKCWNSGKTLVFAGHDLGGALATLAALEYAEMDHWAITFGQPPVFMPPQYKNPGNLYPKALKKNPCKFIRTDRYVPFVNQEIVGENFFLGTPYYDFMVFLNVLIYGMIEEPPNVAPECLFLAANATKSFLEDDATRGNLGSQFGRRYLFPGSIELNTDGVSFLWHPQSKRFNDFAIQGGKGVELRMISDPDLFAASDCSAPTDMHKMETYVAKVQKYAPKEDGGPGFVAGFPEGINCYVNTDCESNACNQDLSGLLGKGNCAVSGTRPRNTRRGQRKNK